MYSITKLVLFEEWRKHKKEERNSLLCDFVLKDYSTEDVTYDLRKKIQLQIISKSAKFAANCNAANRTIGNFLNKNKSWLEGNNLELKISLHCFCASTTFEGS